MKRSLKFFGIYIVLLLVLIVSISMYWSLYFQSSEKAERYVIAKQSKKSLYFGPRYQVVTDQDESASYVSKKTFDTLEFGDTISGYETAENGFYTKLDFIYDSFILVPLIIGLGFIVMIYTIILLTRIPVIDQMLSRKRKDSRSDKDWTTLLIIIVYSICAVVFILLVSKNLFFKVIPIGKTETEGLIVEQDYNINITSQGDYSTYDLTIQFLDEEGKEYQVNKAVSSSTFNDYEHRTGIDIEYRNRNPYDIFVNEGSIINYISAFFGVVPLLYGLTIYTLYLIYQHYFGRSKEEDS